MAGPSQLKLSSSRDLEVRIASQQILHQVLVGPRRHEGRELAALGFRGRLDVAIGNLVGFHLADNVVVALEDYLGNLLILGQPVEVGPLDGVAAAQRRKEHHTHHHCGQDDEPYPAIGHDRPRPAPLATRRRRILAWRHG